MNDDLIGALRTLLGLYEQDQLTLKANSHKAPGIATIYDMVTATGSPWLPALEKLKQAATNAGIQP